MGHLDVFAKRGRADPGPDADRSIVVEYIERARAEIAGKRQGEAKLLLAQLLFDFQPLILRDTDLKASVVSLLEQCNASALRQRLLIAQGA